ncbi:hypothetical protein [Streptomyces showdoensis]|uniref:Protein kinase domain-containing protein n=1 Tax=Streptomyces showdoensis TaxID=68268 RepID=A0A2P2GEX8_STREW|nr:hypothetical protein [Streptomyces showdoensis]KKZ70068.1 hypothetical protein VO63_30825 [Streptomyces showdoensis]
MTEAGSAPGQGPLEELEFLTHRQEQIRVVVRLGEERRAPARPHLLMRQLSISDGWPVVQYRLPRPAQSDPRAYALLEREVAAAVAVERRYAGEKFADLFTRIVGFDLDCSEPFVLYRDSPGALLSECLPRLGGEEQQKIVGQLAVAVRLLGEAGLVHRALGPETVRWSGGHVRLCEPYAAQRAGEPRAPFGTAPWASPEQRAGRGDADTRDDLWSLARIAYYLFSGHPGPPGLADRADGPPADLGDYRRLTALAQSGLFAPTAAARPSPAELLRLLRLRDPLAGSVDTADPLDPGRERYDAELARKRAVLEAAERDREERERETAGEPPPPRRRFPLFSREEDRAPFVPPPPVGPPARTCPYCLLPVHYDASRLVTIDAKGTRIPLDLSGEQRPAHIREALRTAYHLCPHAEGDEAHELPVPYLVNGEPLSIAFVGSSAVGKTHLMAAMLGEVELGGLEPYGLKALPLNPDAHRAYLRERVQSLQQGRQLGRTGQQTFARFADGLLVSAPGRTPRPVVFFDLAGEDLAKDGAVTSFLMGVDAFVFVVDPLRALRMPALDPVRERYKLPLRDLGDEAFATVLNRLERKHGFVPAPAAVAVNKSDLMRFEPAVDRWLGRALPGRYDEAQAEAESRDTYAFLHHHASAAWLRPFDDHARCTLHFVAATGGQARGDRFPHGARPRRVLAPLLSVFAACGLLRGRV